MLGHQLYPKSNVENEESLFTLLVAIKTTKHINCIDL